VQHTESCNDFPYVFHCHKLEHEDHGMMDNFAVVDPNGDKCPPKKPCCGRNHGHRFPGHGHDCGHHHGGHCKPFPPGHHHGGGYYDEPKEADDPQWFLHYDEEA